MAGAGVYFLVILHPCCCLLLSAGAGAGAGGCYLVSLPIRS